MIHSVLETPYIVCNGRRNSTCTHYYYTKGLKKLHLYYTNAKVAILYVILVNVGHTFYNVLVTRRREMFSV